MDESASAAAAYSTPTAGLNLDYLTTPCGILKIIQFVCGLITWALAASIRGGTLFQPCNYSAYIFIMIFTVSAWILTTIQLILFLFGINSGAGKALPWDVFEFAHNAFYSLFYLISASVQAAFTCGFGELNGAAVFAFFTTIAYCIHAVLSFKAWKGYYPWQMRQPGNHVPA